MAAALKEKQQLPQLEAAQFKLVLKCYEKKEFKKGIKVADGILSKNPDHGETLCLKGLLTHSLKDKKEEAYTLVRKGLKANIFSHVTWHVLGMLQRTDKDYKGAHKSFTQALRRDKANAQILRDLSGLQVHLRDFKGFVESRRDLLTANPKIKANWITFVVANHLNGDFETALKAMQSYSDSNEASNEHSSDKAYENAYEQSEFFLYWSLLLEDAGKIEDAIKMLLDHEDRILDKTGMQEALCRLYTSKGDTDRAIEVSFQLLDRLPENGVYQLQLMRIKGLVSEDVKLDHEIALSEETQQAVASHFEELGSRFKSAQLAIQRFSLGFLTGSLFRNVLEKYSAAIVFKGIPSFHHDLQPLYNCSARITDISEVLQECLSFARGGDASGSLSKSGASLTSKEGSLFWASYYMAQHLLKIGDIQQALQMINSAIELDNKNLDALTVKAEILAAAGDLLGAADVANRARQMDLADRCINAISTRYQLYAGNTTEAENTIAIFQQSESHTVADMQTLWFQTLAAESAYRNHDLALALKKAMLVIKHFDEYEEDQLDFHAYCVRKMTLRSYFKMLKWEDRLPEHQYFIEGACSALRVLLRMHRFPGIKEGDQDEDIELAMASESEKKKIVSKRRKAALKQTTAPDSKPSSVPGAKKKKTVDEDPDGKTAIAAIQNPLAEAEKLVTRLDIHATSDKDAMALSAAVHALNGNLVQAMRCMAHSVASGQFSKDLPAAAVLFAQKYNESVGDLKPEDKISIEQNAKEFAPALQSPDAIIEYFQGLGSNAALCEGIARAMQLASQPSENIATWLSSNCVMVGQQPLDIASAIRYCQLQNTSAGEQLRLRAKAAFPMSTLFNATIS